HRKSGNPADPAASAANQAKIVDFLKSLDAETVFPTNLKVETHDIFIDPPTPFTGTQGRVGVNVSFFGTKADLANFTGIKVKFTLPGQGAVEVPLSPNDFPQDFGQAVISTTWTIPANPGLGVIAVQVDSTNVVPEANENDNTRFRLVQIR